MNRRRFLSALALIPGLGFLRPSHRRRSNPDEIHAGITYFTGPVPYIKPPPEYLTETRFWYLEGDN